MSKLVVEGDNDLGGVDPNRLQTGHLRGLDSLRVIVFRAVLLVSGTFSTCAGRPLPAAGDTPATGSRTPRPGNNIRFPDSIQLTFP